MKPFNLKVRRDYEGHDGPFTPLFPTSHFPSFREFWSNKGYRDTFYSSLTLTSPSLPSVTLPLGADIGEKFSPFVI